MYRARLAAVTATSLALISLAFIATVHANTCGLIPGTRLSVASDPAVQNGVIPVGTCFNPSATGVSTSANGAKQYLLSIAQGLPGTQAPPTQDRINKLNDTFAVCAANFFKAYTQATGVKLTLRSAYRDAANGENARAGGVAGSNHTRGMAIDINPADGNYPRLWDYASKNPTYGVCFPHRAGDRPHIILAGIGGSEASKCAAQGVTRACSGAPAFNPNAPTTQPTSTPMVKIAPTTLTPNTVISPDTTRTNPTNPFTNPFNPTQPQTPVPNIPQPQPMPTNPTPTPGPTTPGPTTGSYAPSTASYTGSYTSPTTASYTGSYTGSYVTPGNQIPFYNYPTTTNVSMNATTSMSDFDRILMYTADLTVPVPISSVTIRPVATPDPVQLNDSMYDIGNSGVSINTGGTNYPDDGTVASGDTSGHEAAMPAVSGRPEPDRIRVTETFSGGDTYTERPAAAPMQNTTTVNPSIVSTLLTILRDFLVLFRDAIRFQQSSGFTAPWQAPGIGDGRS